MYTSITEKDVQDTIISSFCQASAPLRIVVCTIAFGMGLDCVNVKEVIHWGPAPDLESYMQTVGLFTSQRSPNLSSGWCKRVSFHVVLMCNNNLK